MSIINGYCEKMTALKRHLTIKSKNTILKSKALQKLSNKNSTILDPLVAQGETKHLLNIISKHQPTFNAWRKLSLQIRIKYLS